MVRPVRAEDAELVMDAPVRPKEVSALALVLSADIVEPDHGLGLERIEVNACPRQFNDLLEPLLDDLRHRPVEHIGDKQLPRPRVDVAGTKVQSPQQRQAEVIDLGAVLNLQCPDEVFGDLIKVRHELVFEGGGHRISPLRWFCVPCRLTPN